MNAIDEDMTGKVAVITGGNTGIGKETAVSLARMGADVTITSRNLDKGAEAVDEIRGRSANEDVHMGQLHLASFASIRRFAEEFEAGHDRLDVLVNNAGGVIGDRRETEDGFEMTFGVNHLGHFLLTDLLLDLLKNSAPSRIVNVASAAHHGARGGLDFDDLQAEQRYSGQGVYSASKLANILFTRELARRLAGTGVTANCCHPGSIRSEFGQGGDTRGLYSFGLKLARPFLIGVERGARTQTWLAVSPEVAGVSGEYFAHSKRGHPSKAARDDEAARRLWEESEKLVASVSNA